MQEQDPGRNLQTTHVGAFFAEVLCSMKRAFVGAGEKCKEEGATEMKHYELTRTLIFHSLYNTWERGDRRVGNEGVKLSLGR